MMKKLFNVTQVKQYQKFVMGQQLLRSKATSWAHVKPIGLDAIKQLTIKFNNDSDPNKVLLGEGVYKTNEGSPYVLPSVRSAEKVVYDKELHHEYAPVSGVEAYNQKAREFALGTNNSALKENRVATVQAISGTGALSLAASFLAKYYEGPKVVYMPAPTWVNHIKIFKDEGFEVREYRYFDKNTGGLDFEGAAEDIRNAPEGAVVLFHACAHNPTGVDPSVEQWREFAKICDERNQFVFFDSAYQGFATGDPERDAASFRLFIEEFGLNPILCQSFSKNFGLYGERVGALNVVTGSDSEAEAVRSNLMTMIRSSYSNPPIYGARLVEAVFSNEELTKQWHQDVQTMAHRIRDMREALVSKLAEKGSTRDWSHITSQIGMFAYSGLTSEQVDVLREDHHIYMTNDGRISISGLNTNNIDRVAEAIHEVTK
mmetsp:Transcript_6900/g.10097  ORF Transcript_6900/g.10097 Transcript_6900/m.10097 type:complete len:430 (+) Transcript_6900:25-1314(+)|eukprot:CAMPEP_0117429114 /NCGR_PEP_ID=MMETSP0758-20121206/8689_1 /TAXON_ID=63605 /ORGANISM="Percolomonas cosmopolitus, Strain AE-1 (ATCC 50343)" /LENGTH=429 /DNA_ID=CAMNT_0005215881 /DNA_START=17 /DNA_END=1306 /DNA_ORIENTATION=+